MSNNYSENLKNGLLASVDYIAFTVTAPMTTAEVILMMGFSPAEFVELPRGGFGYKRQLKNESNGISVLFDGAEDMGIHVNITGKGVGSLLAAFHDTLLENNPFDDSLSSAMNETVLGLFFQEVLKVGHFSRIDAAIDDKGGNFSALAMCSIFMKIIKLFQNGVQ